MDHVTDIHVHVQPWNQLKPDVRATMWKGRPEGEAFFENLMDDPDALLAEMDKRGIWRVAIINYPAPDVMGFTSEVNEFAAKYAARDPQRIIAFGGLMPDAVADPEKEVDRIAHLGIRGIKFQPPHQQFHANAYVHGMDSLRHVYKRAAARGLVVMIHTGTSIFPGARNRFGHPMDVDDVAVDFPDLQIVMAHGGRPLWMDEAMFVLRRHKNVWLDVSSIPPARLLDYFPRLADVSERVLWGTDWPAPGVPDMKTNLDTFLALPLTDAAKRAIASDNARRLFP